MGKRSLKGWSHLYAGMQLDLVPQFSHSVMYDFFWPHKLQDLNLPCPSPTPGACSNSSPWVSDAIRPSHPLSSPSPPAFTAVSYVVVQSLSRVELFAAHGLQHVRLSCPSPPLELAQTHVHWVSDAIQPSHPLSPPLFLPLIFPSIRVFSTESALPIRWPKYWSFSFNISPSNEHSGLISFRMDWLDLLVVQGTLKSLLQYHSWKASILQHSAFFMVQLSHPYVTAGKTVALTKQAFVSKVVSLLFNMLSSLVIASLPRSRCLLISWLQSPSAVILEPPKINTLAVSIVSPSICDEVMGPNAMTFIFWMLSSKADFSLSSFTFKRLFSSSSPSAIRVVSSVYLRLLIFLPAVLIPACAASSRAFCMMYSAYKLNKQGDNIQPWRTPFPIWNPSVFPCPVLTVASWPAYTFLRRQVRWPGILISWRISHSLLWSPQSKTLAWSIKQMFSGILLLFLWSDGCWQFDLYSSAFSKSSLNIWKFMVCVLPKLGLDLVPRSSTISKLPLAASFWQREPLVPWMPESSSPLSELTSPSPVRRTAVPPTGPRHCCLPRYPLFLLCHWHAQVCWVPVLPSYHHDRRKAVPFSLILEAVLLCPCSGVSL